MPLRLISPTLTLLPSYLEALAEGRHINMQLGHGNVPAADIQADPQGYIQLLNSRKPFHLDRNGKRYTITDHELLWITQEDMYIGTSAFRYDGDAAFIETYTGHTGLAIRPAMTSQGYGSRSFPLILQHMRNRGFPAFLWTCDVENAASQNLAKKFGGELVCKYDDDVFGGKGLKFRIPVSRK